MTESREARIARLSELLERRIVVLDGAMATELQWRGLRERDYRGERFARHPCAPLPRRR